MFVMFVAVCTARWWRYPLINPWMRSRLASTSRTYSEELSTVSTQEPPWLRVWEFAVDRYYDVLSSSLQYTIRRSFTAMLSRLTCWLARMDTLKLLTLGSATSLREPTHCWPARWGRRHSSLQRHSLRPARTSRARSEREHFLSSDTIGLLSFTI